MRNDKPRRRAHHPVRSFPALACLALAAAMALGGCLGNGGLFGGGIGPRDYLSDSDYSTWIIEVDSVTGQAPPQSALDLVRTRMQEVANKPGGIEVRPSDTLPARGGTWSARDIVDLDASTQDTKTHGRTVVTHLLFLDGQFEQENVIGVAIGHGTIAIFSETIRGACGPLCLGGTDGIFRSVLVHEFGHILGLVNNGIAMVEPHEDPDHRGHSSNRNSVMWWQVETLDIFSVFTGGPPTTFDGNDKADLCRAGGKC